MDTAGWIQSTLLVSVVFVFRSFEIHSAATRPERDQRTKNEAKQNKYPGHGRCFL